MRKAFMGQVLQAQRRGRRILAAGRIMGVDDNHGMDAEISMAGRVALSHLGVIRARGADAVSFLQGQLTSDIATLGLGEAKLAGFCSAKGRLQASFIVWKAADDDIRMACSATLLAPTLKRLSMFVLRAQCRLTDASAEVPLVGVVGPLPGNAGLRVWERRALDGGSVVRLPDAEGRDRWLVGGAVADDALAASGLGSSTASEIPLDDWRWLEVRSGVPTIEASTVDQFVPQMLNLELLGGVDFQKGCYPGQEVVARSQYRGTIKRRMFLFDTDAEAKPGQEIFHDEDPSQPAGLVVNAAPAPTGGWSALVEMKLAALERGALHLGAPDGAVLRSQPLPYAIPPA
jgi:folate-binding protein YgfZ